MNPWIIRAAGAAGVGFFVWFLRKVFGGGTRTSPETTRAGEKVGLEDYFETVTPRSWQEISGPEGPPKEPGIYAWYFDLILPHACPSGCHKRGSWTMLYVGKASGNTSTLRRRIVGDHFGSDAQASTLRLTLGCLLEDTLSLRLVKRPSGTLTFEGDGEKRLSQWMREHARVAWASLRDGCVDWPRMAGDDDADVLARAEPRLIHNFRLPLNLDHNDPAICGKVRRIRRDCVTRAQHYIIGE